jgi:asparagine synthase (glutamine-hydrolysing)
MCGIAGVFGRGDAGTVAAMVRLLRHRGPDDELLVSGQSFALAARRLSIVDVGGGRQPVANESETIWAAQNGELYNFQELRRRLVADGHTLHTDCDTEILPHLYERDGRSFPEQIHGMFAVAVWDDARQVGLLARDRAGKKPLYYLQDGDALYFASEIKSLLEVPGFERRIDLEALHHYLSYKHVPHPLSIFQRIRAVPPGSLLTFRPGGEPEVSRYWLPSFAAVEMEEEEAVDRLLELLREGVRRRLMGDVPIGFFLSGGIDSSLSTALAAELSSGPIETFTLTYGAGSSTSGKDDDRRWARHVAERYGTRHHEAAIEFAHFPDTIGRILRCFDEPFAGVVSTYFLSELIAQHVKVAVSGDGADELFGSYLAHRLAQPLAGEGAAAVSEQGGPLLESLRGLPDWEWRSRLLVFTEQEKRALYTPGTAETMAAFDTSEHLRRTAFGGLTATDGLNRVLEAEFRTFLPDQVLAFVDRLSMAHSLEVRSAYLDTDVIEFVASLPGPLKINDGRTKYILKKAAERYFPQEMAWRAKEGFVMPVTDWLLRDLEDYVRGTLAPATIRDGGIFDPGAVTALVDGFYRESGDYRYGNKVLALVVFQEWHRLYFGGRA